MKRLIFILMLIGSSALGLCQSTLLWSEDFNTGLSNYYSDYPDIETDGDTIKVIGRMNAGNGQQLLVVKYDLNGDTISTQTYGVDSVLNNTLIDYKFDSFNHVYLLQKEQLEFYKSKVVIQKYALDGELIWVEQISSPADTSYRPTYLNIANDTSFFVTAFKEYDYPQQGDDVSFTTQLANLSAYTSNGLQIWSREFESNSPISWSTRELFVHNNTAYVFGSDASMVKVDIDNNLILDLNTSLQYGVDEIILTIDTNLLVIPSGRYRISKMDLDGNVLWTEYYGTNLPDNVSADEIRAAYQDSEGNIYVTGRHAGDEYGMPGYSNADILTIKYDNSGNLIWENRYEYGGNNADIANFIKVKNGNVYVGGQSQQDGIGTDYDYVVLKIDAISGTTQGEYRYNGVADGDDAIHSIHVFDNGNVALTGLSYIGSDFNWTTQLLSDVVISVPEIDFDSQFKLFPNPIQSGETLTLMGIDMFGYSIISPIGQTVEHERLTGNFVDSFKLRLDNLSSGLYLIRIESESGILTKRIIVN